MDLQRLFRRSIRRAGIKVAYSQGYNPREMINLAAALSLGFESIGDYFEILSPEEYDERRLLEALNATFPEGLEFLSCVRLPHSYKNLSTRTDSASYELTAPAASLPDLHIEDFLSSEHIIIIKRDKKTKKNVEKDVKDMVFELREAERRDGRVRLVMRLCCASNRSLNPLPLVEALWRFNGLEIEKEAVRVLRTEIFALVEKPDAGTSLVPLGEINE